LRYNVELTREGLRLSYDPGLKHCRNSIRSMLFQNSLPWGQLSPERID
jgi:hypothetical protein